MPLTFDGMTFTDGQALFYETLPDPDLIEHSRIYVRVAGDGLEQPFLTMLDTAAPWCILEWEIAQALGIAHRCGQEMRLSTRLGSFRGRLERTTLTLLADPAMGNSLAIDATVFVSRDWPGTNFIGYNGLLERVRFAIDPCQGRQWFFFGAC